jgi:hypothetical protein
MSQPNPFAAGTPVAPQQQAPAANPFGAPAPAQQQAPAANPFGAPAAPQQQAPAAPQAYAPQQQYAPQAPAQQAYAPAAAQQQTAAPALGPVGGAAAPLVGEGRGPKLPDMYGRLLLVMPQRLENVPRRPEHITAEQRAAGNVNQDKMTATIVILDAGRVGDYSPIWFGGNPHALGGTPHTESAALPYVRKGMWLNQSRLISQARDYLPGGAHAGPNGAPGMVCGRLVKTGPGANDPWYLTTPTDEEVALANAYVGLVANGQYPNPLA